MPEEHDYIQRITYEHAFKRIMNAETIKKLQWLSAQHVTSMTKYLKQMIDEIYDYEHDGHDVRQ